MKLSDKIIDLRKSKAMTQEELAERLNVSRQAVSRWEVGAAVPSTDNLKILSELYGVSVDDILKGEAVVIPQNSDTLDTPPEPLMETQQNRKRKIAIACALILLTLAAIIVVGVTKIREREENEHFPMENMTSEEYDGEEETFSFE